MSLGIFALKVGLVTTVAGTVVATPILLRNKRFLVTESVQSAETEQGSRVTSSETNQTDSREETGTQGLTSEEESQRSRGISADSRGLDSEQVTRQVEREEVRVTSPENTDDLSRTGSQVSSPDTASPVPVVKKEEFDKKCFVVPAQIKGTESNVQLLTCYKEETIRDDTDEEQPEYESLFHVYDQNQKENPIEIKGSLQWNPKDQQLVAKLDSSEKTHIFTATGGKWGGISERSVSLLGRECAIYEATLKDSIPQYTHLLSCGKDNVDFTREKPKGIPLTSWESKR